MTSFISLKKFLLKSFFLLIIFGCLGSGLYLFTIKRDFLFNYKPYYFKAYVDGIILGYRSKDLETHAEGNAESIPVLLYHGLLDSSDSGSSDSVGNDSTNVTVEEFENQMVALKDNGYQTITLSDFEQFNQGKKLLPDKSFLLTFDDGRKDSYYTADPILKGLGYNAVMFAIAGRPDDDKFHLSTDEYKTMIASGRWEIESHGQNDHSSYQIDANGNTGHFLSNLLWLQDQNRLETLDEYKVRVEKDLADSKTLLQDKLGITVTSFAFPFSDYSQPSSTSIGNAALEKTLLSEVEKIYPLAFYQITTKTLDSFNYSNMNNRIIKRIEPLSDWSSDQLIATLAEGKAKDLPYQKDLSKDYTGWTGTWGNATVTPSGLLITAKETKGAQAYLNGSSWWKNYQYTSNIDWKMGSNLVLIARYQNTNNYVDLNFGPDFVRLEEMVNGQNIILGENKAIKLAPGTNSTITLIVNNNTVFATLNGQPIISSNIDNQLSSGGIGALVWSKESSNAQALIRTVNTVEIK